MDYLVHAVLAPLQAFGGKPVAVSLMLLILVAAVAAAFASHFVWERPFLRPLREIAEDLRRFRAGGPGRGEAAFAQLDKRFRESPLQEAYGQFKSSIEFRDGRAYGNARPEEFLFVHAIPGHGYAKWSSTLSGVFLTVGLLFTFMGLSSALLAATADAQAGFDIEKMKQGVKGVLDVSAAKFLTSIAGLVAYIGWTVYARLQSSRQEHAVQAITSGLAALITYRSPSALLQEQVRLAAQMEAQLQNLGNVLAVQIVEGVSASLESHAKSVTEGTRDAINGTLSGLGTSLESVAETMTTMASGVREGISQKVGGAIEGGISDTLRDFTRDIAGTVEAISRVGTGLEATQRRITEGDDAAAKALKDAIEGVGKLVLEAEARMATLHDAVRLQTEQVGHTLASLVREAGHEVLQGAERTNEAARQAAFEFITQISGEFAEAAKAMGDRQSRADESWKEGLEQQTRNLREAGDEAARTLANAFKGIQDSVAALAAKLESSTRAVSEHASAIGSATDAAATAGRALGETATGFTGASRELSGATTQLVRAGARVEELLSSGNGLAARLVDATDRMAQASASLESAAGTTLKVTREQSEGYGELAERLKKVIENLTSGVDELAGVTLKALQGYDMKVTQSIQSLEGAVLDMADLIEDRMAGARPPGAMNGSTARPER